MKKSDYLAILKGHLETRLSPEELEDILSDYDSFFHAGMEEGKTEERMSDELGPPALVAQSLLEGQRDRSQLNKRIAEPEKRLLAFLIDSVIAVVPAFVLTAFIWKIFVLAPVLTLSYPSPLLGTLIYSSYPAYTFTSAAVVDVTDTWQSAGSDLNNQPGSSSAAIDNRITPANSSQNPISPALRVMAGVSIGFYLFYTFVCTLLLKGQTIGKKLMKIHVQRSNNESARSGAILVREVIGKILINTIPVIPMISLFTMLFTRDRKTLHDMLSDTVVSDK